MQFGASKVSNFTSDQSLFSVQVNQRICFGTMAVCVTSMRTHWYTLSRRWGTGFKSLYLDCDVAPVNWHAKQSKITADFAASSRMPRPFKYLLA